MEKGIQNIDVVVHKVWLTLIKATNHKWEVAREKQQKRKEMVEKRKIKAMVVRRQRVRGGISLSSEKKENYESDTRQKTDPDQAGNNKNLLQLGKKEAKGK